MGGIKASVEGRTSIRGLYAIGECASTGLFMGQIDSQVVLWLECVVCAYELADYLSFANLAIPKKIDENIRRIIDIYSQPLSEADYNIELLKANLKDIMWNNVGIIRSEENLLKARKEVENLKKAFKRTRKCLNKEEYEYRNMLSVAPLIIDSALSRKESRGAHCRSDYSQLDRAARHTNLLKNEEKELINVK